MIERAFMIRSFQMKLALLSTLVSAVVLTVFALVFWHFVGDSHQQRLDRDLAGLAHQLLASGVPSLDELPPGEEQVTIYGEELRGYATLLTNSHQGIVRQSDNWPQAVTAALLPNATRLDQTRLPLHSHDGHSPDDDHSLHSEHLDQNGHSEGNLVAPQFKTVGQGSHQWRLVGLRSGSHTLHVALNLATFNSNLNHIRGALVLIVCLALLVSAVCGWWVARRALRPVRTLTEMAEGITASVLGQRIEDDGADLEFARLINVFNEMLGRLDTSFRQAVRFSADASHELKTPLAIMQGEVESALQRTAAGSEEQLALASQLEEIQRLNNLVGKLLLLSHADSGALHPTRDPLDFSELVQRVCEDIPALDPDLTVDCRLDPDIELAGDPDLLRQVVQNLVVNAVSYNCPNGWLRCELKKTAETALLRISNSAEPISADQFGKIFRRFYRLDEARTGDHAGLGLSLAREITRVHGGRLELTASDESGTVFELELPLRI
jgi:two-component system, OmpR family, heavy metal sensor histidine kinase CusS